MEQNTQEVTLEQLLQISIDQLKGIAVPVSYAEQISLPILRVINNLSVGLEAISKSDRQPKPAETKEEEADE